MLLRDGHRRTVTFSAVTTLDTWPPPRASVLSASAAGGSHEEDDVIWVEAGVGAVVGEDY